MSVLFLSSFLLACAIGAVCAWRMRLDAIGDILPLFLLPLATIAATLTIAAEVSSPLARYASLAAIILASISCCGATIAAHRIAKAEQLRTPREPRF